MLAGLNDINKAKDDLEELKEQHSDLYEQLLHVVSLTRQLQIKYGYMGSLLMDEDLSMYKPKFVRESILAIYQEEVQKLKEHPEINLVKDLVEKHRNVSDSKVFQLILGAQPELLQGSTFIR